MSNKKKVIGITGGIATGKSVVTSYLRAHDYEVIDADAVVRELQEVGGALYLAIRDTFGEAYFLKNGELDRATFGALIFSDSAARNKLSSVQDAIIRTELLRRCETSQSEIIFMDIPVQEMILCFGKKLIKRHLSGTLRRQTGLRKII